jgi:predicted RNase H-like HicB family nuclease
MDGLYFTDSEINSCYFTGDSILTILQNMKSVKMLYTKKFHHGDYISLGNLENGQ